ncbi:MAG: hypothetical protein ABIG39_01540 [Candidatus Micrarchaeota archaeon]
MNRLDKLVAYLKEFGLRPKPKVENFEHKIVIQKTVCLLELMGAKMDYRYSLYIRGPYSPELTRELYSNKERIENLKTDYSLSRKEMKKIEKIREHSERLNPTLLEIMATYSFLTKELRMSSKDAIIKLKKLKPFFSESRIAVGISRSKLLFPPSEGEVKRMKAEFKAWEDASDSDTNY